MVEKFEKIERINFLKNVIYYSVLYHIQDFILPEVETQEEFFKEEKRKRNAKKKYNKKHLKS